MESEGYVKFEQRWESAPPLNEGPLQALIDAREAMYTRGLIGFHPSLRVGFGNISRRCTSAEAGLFIISGTQTGQHVPIRAEHFTTVMSYDLAANRLHSRGPLRASSESLTHAAVYSCADAYQAVIHVHSLPLWQRLLHQWPTTNPDAAYGTPEMAEAVQALYATNPATSERGVIVMGGHEEGLLAFGRDLAEAQHRLDAAIKAIK